VKDLAGMRFGRLLVIDFDFESLLSDNAGKTKWKCLCDCGNEILVRREYLLSGHTLSCGCYRLEQRSGENNWNWNYELTDEERIINRAYPEYRKYVRSVRKRDKHTCQVCGAITGEREVHHLYSYSHYPEHRLNVDYGVVICKDEHVSFHTWMGGTAVECVPADFDRWLYETSCLTNK